MEGKPIAQLDPIHARYDPDSVAGRLLAGDPEACQIVMTWIGHVLARPRFRPLRDERQDLQQQVLCSTLESLRAGRFDAGRAFQTYVQAIARYTARDTLVSRIREPHSDLTAANCTTSPPLAEHRAAEREQIRRVMGCASAPCRQLFRLFFYEQRSYVEIAETLDIPVGTVKSRLFRCIKRSMVNASVSREFIE